MNCMDNLKNCKAVCCKELAFFLEKPNPIQKDYYEKHGCKLIRLSHTKWKVLVPSRCEQLTEDNKCGLHGTPQKPLMCRRFGEETVKNYHIDKKCVYHPKFEPNVEVKS